jgi:hypothetical protein
MSVVYYDKFHAIIMDQLSMKNYVISVVCKDILQFQEQQTSDIEV